MGAGRCRAILTIGPIYLQQLLQQFALHQKVYKCAHNSVEWRILQINQLKIPVDLGKVENLHFMQLAIRQILLNRKARDEGNAQLLSDHPFHNLDIVYLHHDSVLQLVMRKGAVDQLPVERAAIEQNQPLPCYFFDRDLLA